MNDFKKYATKHLGMNSLVLDDVIKSQAGYLNPYILEERQLNVGSPGRSSDSGPHSAAWYLGRFHNALPPSHPGAGRRTAQ